MTREEAIRILKDSKAKISPHDLSFHVVEHEKNEALDMAIKALEQESVLDKIRTEIDELPSYVAKFNGGDFAIHIDKEKVFEVIDKYKAESGEV